MYRLTQDTLARRETIFDLIRRNPDIHLLEQRENELKFVSSDGDTVLHAAIPHVAAPVFTFLLQKIPTTVFERNKEGQLPLHKALESSSLVPAWLIEELLQHYPQSASEAYKGDFPLHIAVKHGAPCVPTLLHLWPEAASCQDSNGDYPFFIALEHKASLDTLHLLYEANKAVFGHWTSGGQTVWEKFGEREDLAWFWTSKAFMYIREGTERGIHKTMKLLRRLPKIAHLSIDGDYLIHVACRSARNIDLFEEIVDKDPESVKRQDSNSNLPIHLLCRPLDHEHNKNHKSDIEILCFLLDLWPRSIRITDSDGNLPLHIALVENQTPFVLEFLAKEYPTAIRTRMGSKWNKDYPVVVAKRQLKLIGKGRSCILGILIQNWPKPHYLCSRSDIDACLSMIHLFPKLACEKDGMGQLPLHVASQNGCDTDSLERLISFHRASIRVQDSLGRLPLHESAKLVSYYAKHWTTGFTVRDRNGNLPLFLHGTTGSLNEIYVALVAYPGAVSGGK